MTHRVAEVCQTEGLTDTIVAVEMTGIYHKPVFRAFRKAGFDTRVVRPFASNHYRQPLHAAEKTDDYDLEAIFHAAVNGYGVATLPVGEVYQLLQAVSRHRHNLVKQRARLMVQMRRLLHQTMPGFADLLLSVTGINVVSAARLAGEAGPIEHYALARAINGRAGLYPSRYQSDQVDHADGSLVRQSNRQLRGAAMLVADNLIKCHPYYRGLSELWKQRKVDPRDCRCRIANRAMRMVYQLVAGRQVWRGRGVDREYLLAKLQEFHRVHHTPIDQAIRDLNEALTSLPKSAYAAKAQPLADLARKKHPGPQRIGDFMIALLIRLGVTREELGVPGKETVQSKVSEARSSD